MSLLFFVCLVSSWQLQTSGVSTNLYNISCVSDAEAWAVGDSGTIIHTIDGGETWQAQSSGTVENLRGVDFIDSLNGWTVGYGPILLHTTDGGESWTEVNSGSTYELFNVAFVNSNRGWITGRNGTIIGTYDGGNTWGSELAGEWAWIFGITVISPSLAWVMGADWFMGIAPIFKYNGTTWSKQFDIMDTKTGREISAADSQVVWAVGGGGVIFYTADGGSNWVQQISGTTVELEGVSAKSTSLCWVVGADGLILHTTNGGADWYHQQSPVSDTLLDIVMKNNSSGWIVGGKGVILHTNDGGAGIEKIASPSSPQKPFFLFPDPVKTSLHMLLFADAFPEALTMQLFDIDGRLRLNLYKGTYKREFTFSLSRIPAGVYFLVIQTPEGRFFHRFTKLSD